MKTRTGLVATLLMVGLLWSGMAEAACSKCGEVKCGSCMQRCGCASKCGCASQNYCRCKSKCRSCWGGCGSWVSADACCPPEAEIVTVCVNDCGCQTGHPYEQAYNGSSLICDTGCATYIPCKRVGVTCETKCRERNRGCGCECQTDYCMTQECHEVERPRVVPWWYSGGRGNVYLEAEHTGPEVVADWAGGAKLAGTAGSPAATERLADAAKEEPTEKSE